MKGDILAALDYPRQYIGMQLKSNECIHGGFFNKHDAQCLECDSRFECRWLNENDECVALEKKSVEKLINSLEFSLEYIDGRIADWGHNIGECQCDSCQWLKQAEGIYNRFYRS